MQAGRSKSWWWGKEHCQGKWECWWLTDAKFKVIHNGCQLREEGLPTQGGRLLEEPRKIAAYSAHLLRSKMVLCHNALFDRYKITEYMFAEEANICNNVV